MTPVQTYFAAWKLATDVHIDQRDLGGEPYIGHLATVTREVSDYEAEDDFTLRTVAVLHDIIEDGTGVTADSLLAMGIPGPIVEAVVVLTRLPDEDYSHYIDRVALNPLAAIVKKADLRDNMDITRLPQITDGTVRRLKKYHAAYNRLITGAWK